MKFERMGIYKKTDKYGISYMMVLGTSGGINIAYFTNNGEKYENIENPMKEGYFQFDHCMYIPVSRIYSRNLSFVRKVSYREYSDMMSKISDYFLGNIVLRNGKFYYYDENMEDEKEIVQEEPKIEIEERHVSINTDKNPTAIERKQQRVIINAVRDPDVIKSQEDALRKLGIPIEFDRSTENHIHGIEVNINDNETSCTELIAGLSDDDILAITASDWYTVSKKYNISESTAFRMIRECKIKMGFAVKDLPNVRENFQVMFDKGCSIADICRSSGRDEHYVKSAYSRYCIAQNAANSFNAIDKKYQALMDNEEYRLLSNAADKSFAAFARDEKCSIYTARKVSNKVRDFLCKNIFYSAGFGATSFYDIDEYISSIRNSSNNAEVGIVMVYDICKSLKQYYEDTYDAHSNILIGIESIPESIPKYLRSNFLALIYNHIHCTISSKNRHLDKNQRESVIKNNRDCICDIMVNFMMVDKKKIEHIRVAYAK